MDGLLETLDEQPQKEPKTGDVDDDTNDDSTDVEMQDAEAGDEAQAIPNQLPERTIDDKELDLFVDIFAQHAITNSGPGQYVLPKAKPPQPNGYSSPVTNGILKTKNTTTNGITSTKTLLDKPSPIIVRTIPTPKVGEKRKKSLG
ncbi:hypothetical protein FRC03_006547 [Tulasnella sp. 419]|nr:hypothetical protein FRC03_006547 [Tulasnella sp. 419]